MFKSKAQWSNELFCPYVKQKKKNPKQTGHGAEIICVYVEPRQNEGMLTVITDFEED